MSQLPNRPSADSDDTHTIEPVQVDFSIACDRSFEQLMSPPLSGGLVSSRQLLQSPDSLAPIALAYIGDAVFELYVRSRLLHPPKRIRDYHQQVVSQVKAERQSQHADDLLPHLSDAEKDMLRRGRNATTGRNRRAKGADYQKATGFEALVGFLYLSDPPRLINLLDRLDISD